MSATIERVGDGQVGGHRYAAADEELTGFFLATAGARGCEWEVSGGKVPFDANSAAERMLTRCCWLSAGPQSLQRRCDSIAATLAQLDSGDQAVLTLVYTPHAWPSWWAANALSSPWGGGSLAGLALSLPGSSSAVRGWLLDRDIPPKQELERREGICRKLRNAASGLREAALASYAPVMAARIAGAKAAASAKRRSAEARSARLLVEEFEIDASIARAVSVNRMRRRAA
jgi:hypothetical protein